MERKSRVDEICRTFGSRFKSDMIQLNNFLYFPEQNLLYCKIQKAGTSTWLEGTFARLAEQMNLNLSGRFELKNHFKIRNKAHWNEIMKRNPVSFANVRHPFER